MGLIANNFIVLVGQNGGHFPVRVCQKLSRYSYPKGAKCNSDRKKTVYVFLSIGYLNGYLIKKRASHNRSNPLKLLVGRQGIEPRTY